MIKLLKQKKNGSFKKINFIVATLIKCKHYIFTFEINTNFCCFILILDLCLKNNVNSLIFH